jgi:hypothetical protein
MLAAQVHPLVLAIPKFIQVGVPLPPLKPMVQSRRGAVQMLAVAGLRLGLKNRQVGEKWVADDCSYLCKGLD